MYIYEEGWRLPPAGELLIFLSFLSIVIVLAYQYFNKGEEEEEVWVQKKVFIKYSRVINEVLDFFHNIY